MDLLTSTIPARIGEGKYMLVFIGELDLEYEATSQSDNKTERNPAFSSKRWTIQKRNKEG